MRCARCGNEVFRISARYGEPSFYCRSSAPVEKQIRPIRICMRRRPPEVRGCKLQKGAGRSDRWNWLQRSGEAQQIEDSSQRKVTSHDEFPIENLGTPFQLIGELAFSRIHGLTMAP